MDRARAVKSALPLLLLVGCQAPIPPRPEALVVVSTDLPVLDLSARLRVDVFDDEGVWRTSNDLARPDPGDWPVSFSVFTDEGPSRAWLRLRVYPEGGTRRYEGERFSDVGGAFIEPAPQTRLQLIENDRDVTPELEPHPLVTVDRLVAITLEPERRGRVLVALRADCAGTMAQWPDDGRGPNTQSETCIDTWGQRSPTPLAEVEDEVFDRDAPSLPELAAPCSGDTKETHACIPGGATVLGSRELALTPGLPTTPERLLQLSTYSIDRDEVTVGRYRAALAKGHVPVTPVIANAGPIESAVDATSCTWSTDDLGREDHPLNCVSWDEARAFCQFEGGDLPTEAQWERAARRGVDVGRSRYPWGQDTPTCERTVHARWPLAGAPGVCQHLDRRPQPIRAAAGDVTLDGVHDLGGSVQEWVLDGYLFYDGEAWGAAGLHDPSVEAANLLGSQTVRGASWPAPPTFLNSAVRTGIEASGRAPFLGFRCAYPEPSP